MRGNPSPTSRALQEGVSATGETQELAETSSVEGMRSLGVTWADHRRHSRRTEAKGQPEDSDAGSAERERGTGQPGNATRAGWEDAGCGATRNLIGRQNGTMHDPMSYTIIRKAPEAARSLAFSILDISRNQSVADFRMSRSSSAVKTVARRGKSPSVRQACTSES